MYPAYVSKCNIKREKGEGWHYIAVKRLSVYLRGTTSNFDDDDNYCLNRLHSFRQKFKLQSRKKD